MSPKNTPEPAKWEKKTVTMFVRRGHGKWFQVRTLRKDGTEVFLIMREVSRFRELGDVDKDPFE